MGVAEQLERDAFAKQGKLLAALAELRRSYGQVAAVIESIATLRSLGGEAALIEMALFAQSHERTVDDVWHALGECEARALQVGSEISQTEPVPATAAVANRADASGTYEVLANALESSKVGPSEFEDADVPVTQVDFEETGTVLVVDDEPAVLRAFGRILSQRYEVLTARDGAEALRVVLANDSIDAIICDLDMPKLDGGAFFTELGELKPQLLQRVAFCTGAVPSNRAERLLKGLHAPVLHKPVAAESLLSVVDSVRTR